MRRVLSKLLTGRGALRLVVDRAGTFVICKPLINRLNFESLITRALLQNVRKRDLACNGVTRMVRRTLKIDR
ncbi:hypothetical protein CHELA1G11_11324 [Hyphomicrobiales bacterium]|nr:hypothetical protein CHELA1G11_11324 [Hyphomicrobiales bacterium]CAH1668563.1 hypothetical protein CHELA1G2_12985 [Hyphomicrobiales bacterium]